MHDNDTQEDKGPRFITFEGDDSWVLRDTATGMDYPFGTKYTAGLAATQIPQGVEFFGSPSQLNVYGQLQTGVTA